MNTSHFLGLLSAVVMMAGCAAERPTRYGSTATYGDSVIGTTPAYDSSVGSTDSPRYDSYQGAAADAQLMSDADRLLANQVRSRCDPLSPGGTVAVYTRNGRVTLTGTVAREQDRIAVVNAVRTTPGVVAVSDQLQVQVAAPTGRYEDQRVYAPSPTDFFSLHVRGLTDTDRVLGQRILEGLRADTVLPTLMPIVNIEVSESRVIIRGTVQSHDQKRTIVSAIQRAAGVNNVYDELQVSPLPR
jgi:hypothetical protein